MKSPDAPAKSPFPASYLDDPAIQTLLDFFRRKGLDELKEEDRLEQWYDDWIAYQAKHHLYADLLSPKQFSSRGAELNLLRLTRFLEVFAYCSPSHGYSLQVSFLGIFSILMGGNSALKHEAVKALENGALFAFGVSEKEHGSDLLGNEFLIRETVPGKFIANGTKYYIGNANTAAIISILARKQDRHTAGRAHLRALVLLALRPNGLLNPRKIRTFGVRPAFVGEFEVKDHELDEADIIASGRKAWDAVFGTVTLGKFFLGFGAIGICAHALEEASAHLGRRILFGKPAIEMPHLHTAMAEASTRLAAMKLYAYRAVDYVQIAGPNDRRYILFTAVQKAKVSTEGVKVMALLSECIGAKGFEADTYFEMALRDVAMIPGLEGSAHINLGLAAQFIPAYFNDFDSGAALPKSLTVGQVPSGENPYLMEASMHGLNTIRFPEFRNAYRALETLPNVRIFLRQVIGCRLLVRYALRRGVLLAQTESSLALGGCLALITYAQLIAENAVILNPSTETISAIFHFLVRDFSVLALTMATLPQLDDAERTRIRRLIVVPQTRAADWNS